MKHFQWTPAALALVLLTMGVADLRAQSSSSPTAGDGGPDSLQALNVFIEDSNAATLARVCAESEPDFMSRFQPAFSSWRVANAAQISLGSKVSTLFKSSAGEPMDVALIGQAAAEKLRAAGPDERRRVCEGILKEVSSAQ